MIEFKLNLNNRIKILCLGAHCDDIEIGCGGTLLNLLRKYKNAQILWVVFSSDSIRKKEAKSCANVFLKNSNRKKILIGNFRNGYFPYIGGDIKDYFEKLKISFSPDLIFTHYRGDLHQDHRIISELTRNTFRDHLIMEYEIPKYDGDFGTPNLFVPLDFRTCHFKIKNILKNFESQTTKHWFTKELFYSTLRIRGMECCSRTKYAEAFYCNKILLDL